MQSAYKRCLILASLRVIESQDYFIYKAYESKTIKHLLYSYNIS